MRNDISEKQFYYIFKAVQKTCSDWDVDVKISRRVGWQVITNKYTRSNIETDIPEAYFRVSLFLLFLDLFTAQIQRHILLDHQQILSSFQCLLSSKINN